MHKYNQNVYTFVVSDTLYHAFYVKKVLLNATIKSFFTFKVIRSSDFLCVVSFKEKQELILKMIDDGFFTIKRAQTN